MVLFTIHGVESFFLFFCLEAAELLFLLGFLNIFYTTQINVLTNLKRMCSSQKGRRQLIVTLIRVKVLYNVEIQEWYTREGIKVFYQNVC